MSYSLAVTDSSIEDLWASVPFWQVRARILSYLNSHDVWTVRMPTYLLSEVGDSKDEENSGPGRFVMRVTVTGTMLDGSSIWPGDPIKADGIGKDRYVLVRVCLDHEDASRTRIRVRPTTLGAWPEVTPLVANLVAELHDWYDASPSEVEKPAVVNETKKREPLEQRPKWKIVCKRVLQYRYLLADGDSEATARAKVRTPRSTMRGWLPRFDAWVAGGGDIDEID